MIIRRAPKNTEFEIELNEHVRDTIYLPITKDRVLADSDIFVMTEEHGDLGIYVAGFLANIFKTELDTLEDYAKFYISIEDIYNKLSIFSERDLYKFVNPKTYEDEINVDYIVGMMCAILSFKNSPYVFVYNGYRQVFVKLHNNSFINFIKYNNSIYLIDESTKDNTNNTAQLIEHVVQEIDGGIVTVDYSKLFD